MHRAEALGVYQAEALRDREQRKLAQKHLNLRQLIRKACDVRKPYRIEWHNGIPVSFQQRCQYENESENSKSKLELISDHSQFDDGTDHSQFDDGTDHSQFDDGTGKSDSKGKAENGMDVITHPMLMPDYSKPRFKRPANDKEHPLDQFRSLGWDAFQVIVKADMEQRIEELERQRSLKKQKQSEQEDSSTAVSSAPKAH